MLDRPVWPGLSNIQRYRTWWERRHKRAIDEFELAHKARRQDVRDQQRAEWHEARMAAAKRREQRDLRRQQQEEAAERRREERHALHMARGQQSLRPQQARTSAPPPPPSHFVSQNAPTSAAPKPPAATNAHPAARKRAH